MQIAEVVGQLLSKGVDANTKDFMKWTVLMRASCNGHVAVVQSLLANGANIDMQDDFLGYTAILLASQEGRVDIVRELLEKNANPNLRDNAGWTALMKASQKGHANCVELLLEKGADITIKEEKGKTTRDIAKDKGYGAIVNMFDKVRTHMIQSEQLELSFYLFKHVSFDSYHYDRSNP